MKLIIQKWDNGAAIKLPGLMLEQLGVKIGDSIEVQVQTNTLTLNVAKPRYKLDDLLAQMPEGLPMVDSWDEILPVCKEIY